MSFFFCIFSPILNQNFRNKKQISSKQNDFIQSLRNRNHIWFLLTINDWTNIGNKIQIILRKISFHSLNLRRRCLRWRRATAKKHCLFDVVIISFDDISLRVRNGILSLFAWWLYYISPITLRDFNLFCGKFIWFR